MTEVIAELVVSGDRCKCMNSDITQIIPFPGQINVPSTSDYPPVLS